MPLSAAEEYLVHVAIEGGCHNVREIDQHGFGSVFVVRDHGKTSENAVRQFTAQAFHRHIDPLLGPVERKAFAHPCPVKDHFLCRLSISHQKPACDVDVPDAMSPYLVLHDRISGDWITDFWSMNLDLVLLYRAICNQEHDVGASGAVLVNSGLQILVEFFAQLIFGRQYQLRCEAGSPRPDPSWNEALEFLFGIRRMGARRSKHRSDRGTQREQTAGDDAAPVDMLELKVSAAGICIYTRIGHQAVFFRHRRGLSRDVIVAVLSQTRQTFIGGPS